MERELKELLPRKHHQRDSLLVAVSRAVGAALHTSVVHVKRQTQQLLTYSTEARDDAAIGGQDHGNRGSRHGGGAADTTLYLHLLWMDCLHCFWQEAETTRLSAGKIAAIVAVGVVVALLLLLLLFSGDSGGEMESTQPLTVT